MPISHQESDTSSQEFKNWETTTSYLEYVCAALVTINQYVRGRKGELREREASAFFNSICLLALQIRRIVSQHPHVPVGPRTQPFATRDIVSAEALLRAELETFLTFHHLCAETVDDGERQLRFLLWRWHLRNDSIRVLDKSVVEEVDDPKHYEKRKASIAVFQKKCELLQRKIKRLPAWAKMTAEFKEKAFHVGKPAGRSREDIAHAAGLDGRFIEQIFRVWSGTSHCGPLIISRQWKSMLSPKSQYEGLHMCAFAAIWISCFAMRDILSIFPDADIEVHRNAKELIAATTEGMGALLHKVRT